MAVVSDARVAHLEDSGSRRASYLRGRDQVVNRLYVVRTSSMFSQPRCWWALTGQFLINAGGGVATADLDRLARAFGNVVGALEALSGRTYRRG